MRSGGAGLCEKGTGLKMSSESDPPAAGTPMEQLRLLHWYSPSVLDGEWTRTLVTESRNIRLTSRQRTWESPLRLGVMALGREALSAGGRVLIRRWREVMGLRVLMLMTEQRWVREERGLAL